MSLRDDVKNENNIPFSIQICRWYNNVANTYWISAARKVLQTMVRADLCSQYRRLDNSIAEEAILQVAEISILLRRHYCRP